MATEKTFIAFKPDGTQHTTPPFSLSRVRHLLTRSCSPALLFSLAAVQRGLVGELLARFERRGFQIVALKFLTPSKELAEAHYAEHSARPFFGELVDFLTSGPVVAVVFQGTGAVATGRLMIGQTNPLTSAPGTIRGDYGITVARNIIHGSDSVESANREIALWFTDAELQQWTPTRNAHIY